MNKNRTTGLTIGELKNHLELFEPFNDNLEISEFAILFDKWLNALSDEDYDHVREQVNS